MTEGFFMAKTQIDSDTSIPRIAVGAVVIKDNKILLVQRKHPPHQDEWVIPGGKVKWGESLQYAAEREILEETGIRIKAQESIYTFELIHRDEQQQVIDHYVIVDLMCRYQSGEVRAHSDAKAVHWFDKEQLSTGHINSTTLYLLKDIIHFFNQ
jgi:ADP-ribose pyrophosphatase